MMKPMIVLSLVCLSLSACGKSSDQPAVADGGAPVVATAPPATIQYPIPTGYTFQQYCAYYGGQYSSSNLCSITKTTYGSQWSIQFGSMNTGLVVNSGERLSVSATSNPTVLIGGNSVGSGNVNLVSNYTGYLSFQKGFFSSYSISSIQITTCIDSTGQRAICP